jgi:hypothetical protein
VSCAAQAATGSGRGVVLGGADAGTVAPQPATSTPASNPVSSTAAGVVRSAVIAAFWQAGPVGDPGGGVQ